MFTKILIANRGEIACRVIKTAHRLGVRTVAVFSDADAGARHVRLADEAVHIGPPPARQSYLDIGRIIAAALQTGAQAIHPGYGFLSENENFAAACKEKGIVFVGPPVEAIRAMGSKSAAKQIMERAGVPLVPGYHGDTQDAGFLKQEADRIGYPVLIKATMGGGGKGMRVVRSADHFSESLESCRREATSSFGDDRVLIERYVLRPRHIEMQIFADNHGNCVHLFERDCSVQRRRQKVLEEAPAPGMTDARRRQMAEAAVTAARAVGYSGAGTVEFIADQDGRFYFMEMNTRLQVEHPVTEMITGLDLVEWQLRVANDEPLPLAQDQVSTRGHAVEARVYAEDPDKGFLPSTGVLAHLAAPAPSEHVRVDTGVEQGDRITPYYDPMIAKLIVWDETRALALQRMRQALAAYRVVGVTSNVEFLFRLVASPAFAEADLDTGLIEREAAFLFPPATRAVPPDAYLVAALATLLYEQKAASAAAARDADPCSPWHSPDGWRLNSNLQRRLVFHHGEDESIVEVRYQGTDYELTLDETQTSASGQLGPDSTMRLQLGGRQLDAAVVIDADRHHVFLEGSHYPLARVDNVYEGPDGHSLEGLFVAPMPGRVVALLVTPGTAVKKSDPLLILEAMKMEHTVSAPADGTLNGYRFAVGDQVPEGAQLVDFNESK